jgi:hypothetical protein
MAIKSKSAWILLIAAAMLHGCDSTINVDDYFESNHLTQDEISQAKIEIENTYTEKANESGYPRSHNVEVQLIKSGDFQASGFARVNIIGNEQTFDCNVQKDVENSGIIWSCE